MRPEAWAIVDALRASVDDGTSLTVLGSDKASALPAIHRLAQSLREQLMRAREVFARTNLAEAESLILLLVFFVDERSVNRLPSEYRSIWPWLQSEWLGSITGGRAFFELSTVLLLDPNNHRDALALIGYCLANGFRGQYAGDPVQLESITQGIEAALRGDKIALTPISRLPEWSVLSPDRPWLVPLIYAACGLLVLSLLTLFATWT